MIYLPINAAELPFGVTLSKLNFYVATLLCSASTGGFVATYSDISDLRAMCAGLAVGTALIAFREATEELTQILGARDSGMITKNKLNEPKI